MIAEALAGKRIAVTGATGFLGTALVERLLRSSPAASSCCSSGPAGASTVEQRAKREIFSNDAFDRLRERARQATASTRWSPRRVTPIAGDVGTDGLGLDDAGRGRPRRLRHRHPLRRHGVASTRRSTPPSRSTSSARPASSQTLHDLGVTPHLVAVSTCYVAGNRRGAAPESPVAREPVLRRRRLARRGRRRPPGPRRRRGRQPPPRAPRPVPQGGPPRARRRRHPAAGRARPSSAASAWVKDRMVEAGPGPGRVARLARRLRLHQGARRAGAAREPRRRARVDRAAVDHRVGAAPSPCPGWIRGFRMAEPVIISYARGLLKEFPGVPEGIVDVIPVDLVVAAIIAVAAAARQRRRRPTSSRSRRARSTRCATGASSTSCSDWFTEHPLYDAEGQPIVVPEWSFPGRGRVQAPARAGQERASSGPRGSLHVAARCGASRPSWSATLEEKRDAGRAGARLRRALRRLRRVRGDLRRRPPPRPLGPARRRGPGDVLLRPAGHRLGPLRRRRPPAVGRGARPGAHHAGRARRRDARATGCAARSSPPTATSPPSTSRTR